MDLLGHMKTISSAVEDYIKSKPFLVSALTQGIINLTSLARMMNKDISSVMNKDVRNGAIVMALKRLSSDFEFRSSLKKEGFLKRDPRVKERKKYGRKKARKGFQFRKR